MKLNRDKTTGKILDDRKPVALCGGHHDLFIRSNKAKRGLARPGQRVAFAVDYNGAPCVVNAKTCSPLPREPGFRAEALVWSDVNRWEQLFGALRDTGCNLLRVWVMSGTAVYPPKPGEVPFDLYPFVPVGSGTSWKWKVVDAVERDVWNRPFFDRLAAFAEEADRRGVCIQLTLFNYSDFEKDDGDTTYQTWSRSAWNPTLSLNPPDRTTWGENHLVKGDTPAGRNAFFIKPDNGLRKVQKALVRKVVTTLKGRGNIIFEVMNEPRNAPYKDVALFNSEMIVAINAAAGPDWTPLISVNASRTPANPRFDTDWWREHSTRGKPDFVPNYDRVDIISYHGMTGFNDHTNEAGCNRLLSPPPVDPTSIQNRIALHNEAQDGRAEKKALMFSTDAARIDVLEHEYCDVKNAGRKLYMHVRDGQINTHYDNERRETPGQQALKSDLRNWTFWYFCRAIGDNLGLVHLQNHSNFESSFHKIRAGREEVTGPASPFEP